MSNPTIDAPYKVPGKPTCPRCHEVILEAQDVTPDSSNVFLKGKLIVCGSCALICKVGDSKMIPVSKKEVMTYPPQIQFLLMVTCKKIAESIVKNRNN
jgi:hypothetical protein